MSSRQPITDSQANIEWRSDDGSTFVSIPASLVDRIAGYVTAAYKSLPRRGAEAGGLLIGGVRLGPVTQILVTGFEPIACDYLYGPSFALSESSQAEFRAATARHPAAEILGYYRSHTRAGFGLEASDRELVTRIFPGLSGLILLIKPASALSLSGSYFFFQRGNLEMRSVGPEFPFVGSVPGGIPPPLRIGAELELDRPAKAGPPRPIQEALELSSPHSNDTVASRRKIEDTPAIEPIESTRRLESTRRRKSLQWEIVAAGLMIAVALVLLWFWWQDRRDSGGDFAAAEHSAAVRVAWLGLTVQPGDGGWRITWDPNSPAAREAVRGVLNVTELESRERIPLDVEQIRGGAVTYRPTSNDVAFRLELVHPDSSLSSETYRVLLKSPETASTTPRVPKKSAKPPAVQAAPTPPAEQPAPEKAQKTPENPPSEGYEEPVVLSKVAPEVPEGIRPRITSSQPIDVRVSIDREGRVTSATPLQRGEGLINYLGERAVAAARQWKFSPAKQDGKPVASSRTIHFVFEQ